MILDLLWTTGSNGRWSPVQISFTVRRPVLDLGIIISRLKLGGESSTLENLLRKWESRETKQHTFYSYFDYRLWISFCVFTNIIICENYCENNLCYFEKYVCFSNLGKSLGSLFNTVYTTESCCLQIRQCQELVSSVFNPTVVPGWGLPRSLSGRNGEDWRPPGTVRNRTPSHWD